MSSSASPDATKPLPERVREWVFRLYFAYLVSGVPVEALLGQVDQTFVLEDEDWQRQEVRSPYVPDPRLGHLPRSQWARIVEPVSAALREVVAHRDGLERAIQQASKRWRLDRMPLVDRALLTVGCYELLERRAAPSRRVINRTVELAKQYGEADTRRFVNGILDQIRKDHGIG